MNKMKKDYKKAKKHIRQSRIHNSNGNEERALRHKQRALFYMFGGKVSEWLESKTNMSDEQKKRLTDISNFFLEDDAEYIIAQMQEHGEDSDSLEAILKSLVHKENMESESERKREREKTERQTTDRQETDKTIMNSVIKRSKIEHPTTTWSDNWPRNELYGGIWALLRLGNNDRDEFRAHLKVKPNFFVVKDGMNTSLVFRAKHRIKITPSYYTNNFEDDEIREMLEILANYCEAPPLPMYEQEREDIIKACKDRKGKFCISMGFLNGLLTVETQGTRYDLLALVDTISGHIMPSGAVYVLLACMFRYIIENYQKIGLVEIPKVMVRLLPKADARGLAAYYRRAGVVTESFHYPSEPNKLYLEKIYDLKHLDAKFKTDLPYEVV